MLHYEIVGEGNKTVVCLHGFLESTTMWNVLELDQFARLILIDLPGHGKSGLEGIDSMSEMAEKVKQVVSKENIESYDVIGHSMGGYVALMLKDLDERCDKIILMNSNVWSDSEQKKEDRKRVAKLVQTKKERFVSEAIPNLFQAPENYPEQVAELVEEAKQISSEAVARASIAMSERYDRVEWAYSGALEVYVIQGINDPIANVDSMRRTMVNQMERYFEVHTGHMAHLEATEEVREILRDVLS
ncbi:MAG: hypothetical protein DCO96_11400 [Fluviicola sp. XM-24bin1]|nr:MAG: hypothetical protein DCO96_11400 [Fluviicola sp. XM-24bin1]